MNRHASFVVTIAPGRSQIEVESNVVSQSRTRETCLFFLFQNSGMLSFFLGVLYFFERSVKLPAYFVVNRRMFAQNRLNLGIYRGFVRFLSQIAAPIAECWCTPRHDSHIGVWSDSPRTEILKITNVVVTRVK